jgi:hypothetical protein
MNIKDLNAAQAKAKYSVQLLESQAHIDAREPVTWYKRGPGNRKESLTPQISSYLPLLLCLLISIIVRAFIVIHTQGFIDGDEALVGIQAEHILRGELPIYFYNQPYMGSLEAYIMAGIFAIAGPSVWALRAEPILLTLAVVWLTWKFASVLADTAGLPLPARQWFITIATLLAAIPPLYDAVMELRMLGGYIEIFIFMLLLMLFAFKLTNLRAAGASRRKLAWLWAGIGFTVGFGFWVNPLIIYCVFAVALWIGWDWLKALKEGKGGDRQSGDKPRPYNTRRNDKSTDRSTVWVGASLALATTSSLRTLFGTLLLPALASIPACILGLAPAIYWGALNHWQNVTYVLQLSANPMVRADVQAVYHTRLSIMIGLTRLYATCEGPRILSGALPGENTLLGPLHIPTLVLSGLCIMTTVTLVVASFVKPQPLLLKVRKLAALPLVFAGSVGFIFCVTETSASGLASCQLDLAGRYATPLLLVVPFFVATVFAVVVMLEAGIPSTDQELDAAQGIVERGENNRVVTNTQSAASRISLLVTNVEGYQKVILGLLVGFLIVSIYLQIGFYALSDGGSTLQSPFCNRAPANNDAIIAYLQKEHIQYAWANNWLAYPIVFKTHESIIISDPLPLIRRIPILDRIPAYTQAVLKADRPSFLVFVSHGDPHPPILQIFDLENVKYRSARFPSEAGKDVLVVTPLNQTVSPLKGNSFFNSFFCSSEV